MRVQKFQPSNNPPENAYEKDLERSLDKFATDVALILNGGGRIEDQLDIYRGTITTDATPGVETAIAHGLKRAPLGYWIVGKNKAAHIYDGASAWTATNLYVRSDVASVTAKIIVF